VFGFDIKENEYYIETSLIINSSKLIKMAAEICFEAPEINMASE
jgi:hypothetical protein